jgi:hypothetical protein
MTYKDERIAPSYITQYFEEIEGIQAKNTRLTASPKEFEKLTNMRFGGGLSIEGRKGCQAVGQPSLPIHADVYGYLDTKGGGTGSEIIGLNKQMWRLVTKTCFILRLAGDPSWTLPYNRVDTTTTPSPFRVKLDQGGVNVFDLSVTNGYEIDYTDMYTLLVAIQALGNFDLALPTRHARSAFFQTPAAVANRVTITVNATSASFVGQKFPMFNHNPAEFKWIAPTCLAVTANTMTLAWPTSIHLRDNQGVGEATASAASLPVKAIELSTTTPKILSWQEWEPVPSSIEDALIYTTAQNQYHPFPSWADEQRGGPAQAIPACMVNASQNLYTLAPATLSINTGAFDGYYGLHEGMPWRYDGRFCVRAGLPKMIITGVSEPMFGTVTGTINYIIVPRFRDYRGVVVEGPASDPFPITRLSAFASGNSVLDCSAITLTSGFYTCGAQVAAGSHDITLPIPVTIGHQIKVDDIVYYRTAMFPATLPEFPGSGVVTAVTASTISITPLSGAGNRLQGGDWISSALSIDVYRTKLNGVAYYYDKTFPNNPLASTQQLYPRSIGNDSYLLTPYSEPLDTYEPYPPPRARAMTVHDGALVIGGDVQFPNSIYWSRPGADPNSNVESFPPLNTAVIPSSAQGATTAIFSEDSGKLIIGKDAGHYNLLGNIHNRNISVKIVREGDFGFACQDSMVRANGVIFGLCSRGVYIPDDQEVSMALAERINPLIRYRTDLQLSMSRAHNDIDSGMVHFFIPTQNAAANFANSDGGALHLVLDYVNNWVWFDHQYRIGAGMSGGMLSHLGRFFHVSNSEYVDPPNNPYHSGGLFGSLDIPIGPAYEENFLDHTTKFNCQVATTFLHDGSPSFDKMFLELKLWHVLLPFQVNTNITSTYIVEFYRDFTEAVQYATTTEVWNPDTEFERIIKIYEECSARAMKLVVTVSEARKTLKLSGFEFVTQATQVYRSFRK